MNVVIYLVGATPRLLSMSRQAAAKVAVGFAHISTRSARSNEHESVDGEKERRAKFSSSGGQVSKGILIYAIFGTGIEKIVSWFNTCTFNEDMVMGVVDVDCYLSYLRGAKVKHFLNVQSFYYFYYYLFLAESNTFLIKTRSRDHD